MPIEVQSRRLKPATLEKRFPDALALDVTSRGPEPWVKFSPFYPHGDIPVPCSENVVSQSVEGIWQGLKVFESADIDPDKFAVRSMKGIKRTVRKNGRVLGHREGVRGERLLAYLEARRKIYLPAYRWILENRLTNELGQLCDLAARQLVILLDYETNCNLDNTAKPLSHAGLVKRWLENAWPGDV
jgi:hypothetical protein